MFPLEEEEAFFFFFFALTSRGFLSPCMTLCFSFTHITRWAFDGTNKGARTRKEGYMYSSTYRYNGEDQEGPSARPRSLLLSSTYVHGWHGGEEQVPHVPTGYPYTHM